VIEQFNAIGLETNQRPSIGSPRPGAGRRPSPPGAARGGRPSRASSRQPRSGPTLPQPGLIGPSART
jgi:hypothetical protein